ncbi:MAG TPA: alpha-L-fucosidase [Fimbriimonadaceae bacterium]|nr:alpha-L-fucosidase [Fimbriimonadaceae bacterium]
MKIRLSRLAPLRHSLPALSLLPVMALLPALRSANPSDRIPPMQTGSPDLPVSVPARLRWWQESRFGLFIHWGPVALTGQEISWSRANTNPNCPNNGPIPAAEYDNLYKRFDPEQFNAGEWAKIAKDTGMKYVVLTARHCDGFCLWPTRTYDYNISSTPFKRDVCGELDKAVHQAGLKMGWYYSPMDWRDPDCRTANNAAYLKIMQAQIKELVTDYKTDLMWFDWDGGTIPWDQENTYEIVRSGHPNMIVDNRLDCDPAHPADRYIGPNADYYTPEQTIGAYDDQRPWETCMTLGTLWSWKPNDTLKTTPEVIRILAQCVGGDGNLLLDVGPMPDGRIEPRQVDILMEVGKWVKAHGEAIYGTRGGPFKPGAWGVSTRKGKTIYVHVFDWSKGTVTLPAIDAKVVKARIVSGGPVAVDPADPSGDCVVQKADGVTIDVAAAHRDPADTIIALELDKPALSLPASSAPGSR